MAFGAGKYDTSAFMAGNITISVVYIESNGNIDESTENWTKKEITTSLEHLYNACNWWEKMWTDREYVGNLTFSYDLAYVDTPFDSSYEPINHTAKNDSAWVSEYLNAEGYSGTKSNMLYAYNNDTIDLSDSDFAFTIFFVKADNDSDHKFADGNLAYTSGRSSNGSNTYVVIPYSSEYDWYMDVSIAHEMAHIFGAADEYANTNNYKEIFGYYGIQNTNAVDGNPHPDKITTSLMNTSLRKAYSQYTSSRESLEMIGWRDTDGDGIIDVLDAPIEIKSMNSSFELSTGKYSMNAVFSVGFVANYQNTKKITVNSVDRLLYRYSDEEEWKSLKEGEWKAESVLLDASFVVAEGKQLFWKVVDADGTASTKTFVIYGCSDLDSLVNHEYKTVELSFAQASEDTGIKEYQIRIDDTIYDLKNASSVSLDTLAYGVHDWSLRGKYDDDNYTDWLSGEAFTICPAVLSSTLEAENAKCSWQAVEGFEKYDIELSTNDFEDKLSININASSVSFINMDGGSWKWHVAVDGYDIWTSDCNVAMPEKEEGIKVLSSVEDGVLDMFFADVIGVWDSYFSANHAGNTSGWAGTGDSVALQGKNRIADVFIGSKDASILVLTDDANGDALFVDDMFTQFPDAERQARLANISEIRAGAGDDIIDMTSSVLEFNGNLVIDCGDGNDVAWANSGNTILLGGNGNDTLVGGAGNDLLVGGAGADVLRGGQGSNIYAFTANCGNDTVILGDDADFRFWFADMTDVDVNYEEDSTALLLFGSCHLTVQNVEANGLDDKLLFGEFEGSFGGYTYESMKGLLA